MRKVPYREIIRTARELGQQKGHFSQYELISYLEERFGYLDINERRRITQILRRDFIPVKKQRDHRTGRRIIIFTL